MRELTDEIVVSHRPQPPKPAPIGVSIPGRHVAEVTGHPDGRLAVITWSSPEIDPGLLNPALHVVAPDGTITDLGPTSADAGSPVWWGDEVHYLALTPPLLQAGNAVFDQRHRNLTEGMPACPIDLVQDDGSAPIMVVAAGLDTEFHRLDGTFLGKVRGSHLPSPYRDLDGIAWGVQERLSYQARDGLGLDGLLVLPLGKAREDGPFPLVTIVHGGPYDRFADSLQLHWVPSAQWFAHQGIATFLPNPRGGLGHGHEFAKAVGGRVGLEEWHDIEDGLDLLISEGVADPDRLGIAGWSHGGFMASWATTRTDRFKAALVGAGISDWPRQVENGEWGAFEAALADTAHLSPITYAHEITTPMLIVHGAEDTNVPVEQAELLHAAVEHSELVLYPGEGHSLRLREHRLDLLNRTRRLFAKL
ncbi:alpha/beta hydrolase family protein [Lentzea sp. JNUCC 0626]|uniref:alpha/beta hydrolase family protein n=1 Tax=Lentzea sp. JNUCC 0626 TaxID=3367513 RepID=UPI00374A5034